MTGLLGSMLELRMVFLIKTCKYIQSPVESRITCYNMKKNLFIGCLQNNLLTSTKSPFEARITCSMSISMKLKKNFIWNILYF